MLGPADIEAWRDEAEAAAKESASSVSKPVPTFGSRDLFALPAALLYGEYLVWRRFVSGGGRH